LTCVVGSVDALVLVTIFDPLSQQMKRLFTFQRACTTVNTISIIFRNGKEHSLFGQTIVKQSIDEKVFHCNDSPTRTIATG
jgi:hypothetical protein